MSKNSRKNYISIQFPKSLVRPHFWILSSANCRVFEWTLVMRKRSQNHFRSHFTSKTPYSFDTGGILSTPAWDVHGRQQLAKRYKRDLDKQSRREIKTIKRKTMFIHNDMYWKWSVSENPESRIKSSRFKPYVLSRLRRVCYFLTVNPNPNPRWTPGKNIA